MLRSLSLLVALAALCSPSAARPEAGGRPGALAVPAQAEISVDARLNEPAWDRAEPIDAFPTPEPVRGVPLSQRTEIRILYDSRTLYFGIRAYDERPSAIVASVMRRDMTQRTDDRIQIMLDTFGDRRNGYLFVVNPNGAKVDALIEEGGGLNRQWDGIWQARARIDAQGWVAEIAIPVQTLNFDPGLESWGMNLVRTIPRLNQDGRWASSDPAHNLYDPTHFGELGGLRGLEQGRGIDAVPGLILRNVRQARTGRTYTRLEPAADVFYKINPSLTAVLTTNADFSDAPPDERRANLTRFSLFFPEQRDFFLQDSGIFRFGEFGEQTSFFMHRRRNGQPFFSRRIALSDEGPLGIRFGAKLTGRAGPFNLGALTTRVESHDETDGRWLSVGRASLRLDEKSTLGVLGTFGNPESDAHAKLWGADYTYRTASFRGDRLLEGNLWAQKSSTTGLDGREAAFGARLTYPNDRWFWDLSAVEIQENFSPALGFANRTGIREYYAHFRRRWRPGGNIRTLDVQFRPNLVTGVDGGLQTLELDFDFFLIETEISDTLWLRGIQRREDLLDDFEIRPGIVIPRDSYTFERVQFYLDTSRNRPFEFALRLEWGRFFTGTRLDTAFMFDWRPSRNVTLGAGYERFRVRLPQGDFTTRIARLSVDFAFSPRLSWTNLVQWDNESEDLSWHTRLRWIVRPGRELVFVLDPSFDRDRDLRFDSTRTESVLKLLWTQRY